MARAKVERNDTSEAGIVSHRMFPKICKAQGLPEPVPEYRFHPKRKWRFDYAWPDYGIALEIEGGVWKRGRHNRGAGYIKDMEKYNAATMQGWRIYRVTPKQITSEFVYRDLKKLIGEG